MQEKEEIEILNGIIAKLNVSENRIIEINRILCQWRETMKTSDFFNRVSMLYKLLMEKSDMKRLADYIRIKYGSGLGKKYFETQPQNIGNDKSDGNDNVKDLEIARLKAEIERLNKELKKKTMDKEEKLKIWAELAKAKGNLTVILEQNNEHNIENVEAGGIGIQINNGVQTVNNDKKKPAGNKDARKKKPSGPMLVKDTFTYRFLNDEDGTARLIKLYQYVQKAGWIPKETKHEDFTAIFEGKPTDVKVKWTGKQSDLYALINRLESRGLISCPKGVTKWVITGSHFLDCNSKQFSDWNSQKTPKKSAAAIEALADLLDPTKDDDKKRLSSWD